MASVANAKEQIVIIRLTWNYANVINGHFIHVCKLIFTINVPFIIRT